MTPDATLDRAPDHWNPDSVMALFDLPLPELIYRAQQVHRRHFDPCSVQVASLLSIKTGGCAEDCGYCAQSAHHPTGLKAQRLMPLPEIIAAARRARDAGATRFCMGAAWRSPKPRDMPALTEAVRAVKDLGLQTCMTLGMLDDGQAQALAQAGLDYYNHNLDTSPAFYGKVIGTRTYQDRLDTIARVRAAGIKVCCGGIIGMGESREDRAALLAQLASLQPQPESVPVNLLIPIPGTPLADAPPLDPFELVRTIAAARITMPRSAVRLSAGRHDMPESLQALCLLAGANSLFQGDKLLTAANPEADADRALLRRLGMRASVDGDIA
jgi:biotin synthetase